MLNKVAKAREKIPLTMGIIWGSIFIASNFMGVFLTAKKRISLMQRIAGFTAGAVGSLFYL